MRTNLSQLEFSILSVLMEKECYGLEMITAIELTTEGQWTVSLGSLYTTLRRMENKGFVTSRWGDADEPRAGARRRYYRLTGLGIETLTQTQRAVANLLNLSRPSEV